MCIDIEIGPEIEPKDGWATPEAAQRMAILLFMRRASKGRDPAFQATVSELVDRILRGEHEDYPIDRGRA